MKRNSARHLLLLVILFGCLISIILSLSLGSVKIPFDDVITILLGGEGEKSTWTNIVIQFRLPKVITALLAGAALAVSGLQMQTLFQNPLADPYILGISSGASLGVSLVVLATGTTGTLLLAGIGFFGDLSIALAACLGSALVLFLVLFVSRNARNTTTMLLIGLMIGYVTSAIVSVLIYFSLPEKIHTYLSWTFGSFGGVTWSQIRIFVPVILLGLLIAMGLSKSLNALLLGEHYAQSMGLHIKHTRMLTILSSSLLAGITTAFCGPIGFLGIAVPHISRMIFDSNDHKFLIPAVTILGALIAVVSDIIAQLPGHQQVLPINVVTSLIGVPVVLWVLLHRQRGNR
ncbi:MAG: iron ABC transporter permease [Anaerolineae bacterium]|nr:iron ABC transporter permease [Anaerolineae bacterium]